MRVELALSVAVWALLLGAYALYLAVTAYNIAQQTRKLVVVNARLSRFRAADAIVRRDRRRIHDSFGGGRFIKGHHPDDCPHFTNPPRACLICTVEREGGVWKGVDHYYSN